MRESLKDEPDQIPQPAGLGMRNRMSPRCPLSGPGMGVLGAVEGRQWWDPLPGGSVPCGTLHCCVSWEHLNSHEARLVLTGNIFDEQLSS